MIKLLLEYGEKINVRNYFNETLFHAAAWKSDNSDGTFA